MPKSLEANPGDAINEIFFYLNLEENGINAMREFANFSFTFLSFFRWEIQKNKTTNYSAYEYGNA